MKIRLKTLELFKKKTILWKRKPKTEKGNNYKINNKNWNKQFKVLKLYKFLHIFAYNIDVATNHRKI